MDIRDLPILRARAYRAGGNDAAGRAQGSSQIVRQLVVTGRCPAFRSPAVIDPDDDHTWRLRQTVNSFGLVVDNDARNLMVRVPASIPTIAALVAAWPPSAQ